MFEKIPNPVDEHVFCALLDRLQAIFVAMDKQYIRAAAHYQFQCGGCTDNCCRTQFYHHTYLEYFYLRRGYEKLDPRAKNAILARAEGVCRETARADERALSVRLMCPLNDDSLCTLYAFRPMICRLHGIRHELKKPGQNVSHGPGCSTFDKRCADKGYFKFDRTPFYTAVARLESEFKKTAGIEGRIKMTVAEMIKSLAPSAKRNA